MDNAVDAFKMAFAMIVFVIALSTVMYAFTAASSAAQVVSYYADDSNFFDNIESTTNLARTQRVVKGDTIIPTLYRYYKENFSVRIYDATSNPSNPTLIQLFDINTEGDVNRAAALSSTQLAKPEEAKARRLLGEYNNPSTSPYMFEAPWIGNTIVHTKTRIDLFVSGTVGYINDVEVDYRDTNLRNLLAAEATGTCEFVEEFVKYTFTGDTISVGEGEDIETITGNKKAEDKIDITYTLRNK